MGYVLTIRRDLCAVEEHDYERETDARADLRRFRRLPLVRGLVLVSPAGTVVEEWLAADQAGGG